MAIYEDPTVDYDAHPGRADFEKIRESGNLELLMNHLEAFIRRGHDPKDPHDSMYRIMGITPRHFDFIVHDFTVKKEQKLQDTDVFFNKAASQPTHTRSAPGVTKQHGKVQRLGFGPEDEM